MMHLQDADIAVDEDGLRFLGHVLEAYFVWRSNTQRLGFVSYSTYMRIPQAIENRRVINLSDDQFVRVDQSYAQCTHQRTLSIEYGDTGTPLQKARKLGLGGPNNDAVAGQYKSLVKLAEMELYMLLSPDLSEWQDKRERETL